MVEIGNLEIRNLKLNQFQSAFAKLIKFTFNQMIQISSAQFVKYSNSVFKFGRH